MKKESRLLMTDDLIVDITLVISERIAKRLKPIKNRYMSREEKQHRCDCIHVLGEDLQYLSKLRQCVQELQEKDGEAFAELRRALRPLMSFHFMEINIKERVTIILA